MEKYYEIKQLDRAFQPLLGEHSEFVDYGTKSLIPPGENYGSLILDVKIKVRNKKDSSEEIYNLVGKLCPQNEWIKRMFNIPVTFKSEINFYDKLLKELRNFESEYNMHNVDDIYPKFYIGRCSLDENSDVIDDDALLLLENLKYSNYYVVDRIVGLNYDAAAAAIKALAVFHAEPIALKQMKPEIFENKFKPYLKRAELFADVSKEIEEGMIKNMIEGIARNEECKPLIAQVSKWLKIGQKVRSYGEEPREPFATLTHNDFWGNNVMVKYIDDEVKVKMLDFQLFNYGSPAVDLIFFLFTSIQLSVVKENLDNFIDLYYTTFIDTLKLFNCNVKQFNREAFSNELKIEARNSELFHILSMLKPIYNKKDKVQDLNNLRPEDMLSDTVTDDYYEKMWFTVLEFAKRNWI